MIRKSWEALRHLDHVIDRQNRSWSRLLTVQAFARCCRQITCHVGTSFNFVFHTLSGLNMSGLITTLWYMLWIKSHENDTGEFFLRHHFPLRVIKYHHTEYSNPFVVVFRECSVLIFVKYDPQRHMQTFEISL